MQSIKPSAFKWRHFNGDLILQCVRWYCKYGQGTVNLIAAAISGNAKVIVSGDQDLLVLREYGAIEIMTAKSFLQLI